MTSPRETGAPSGGPSAPDSGDAPRHAWLNLDEVRGAEDRTLLLEMTARALFPTILVFSLYLLLVGHYGPGGGFSGGLVAGLAFVLRYLAGGRQDLAEAVRVRPQVVIGTGLSLAVLTGLAPPLVGGAVLSSAHLSVHLPVFGTVETQTSLLLDIGVYLLIVGAVLELLRSLGGGIERDMEDAGER